MVAYYSILKKLFLITIPILILNCVALYAILWYNNYNYSIIKMNHFNNVNTNISSLGRLTYQERETIFCLIKSHLGNYRKNKTMLVYRVWAHKCDNYRFIMYIPEEYRPANYALGNEYELETPLRILQPKVRFNETHARLTPRVYHAVISIYTRFPNYTWYYIVDDDSYVNMGNMREFLSGQMGREKAVTFGFDFNRHVKDGYHSGGCGYVISGVGFKRLGAKLKADFNFCTNSGVEDKDTNHCLRELGVAMGKSVDENGRQRFLVLSILGHFYGRFPNWLIKFTKYPLKKVDCIVIFLIK
jgi:hypothetical protein